MKFLNPKLPSRESLPWDAKSSRLSPSKAWRDIALPDFSNVVLVVEMAVTLCFGGPALLGSLAIGVAAFSVARSHFPIFTKNLGGPPLAEGEGTESHVRSLVWPMANRQFPLGTLLLSFRVASHVLEQRDRAVDESSLSKVMLLIMSTP